MYTTTQKYVFLRCQKWQKYYYIIMYIVIYFIKKNTMKLFIKKLITKNV